MKYVALLSGGKDSCYNLLHCRKNGHDLVAAASLGPEPGRDEIDSYMYQTVGQDAIEYVAKALDVPLYRQVISGSAVDMSSEYGSRSVAKNGALQGDETEDLFTLLSTVKTNHPDVQGVSVGAILSNYQRVRVEHVCRRLSLTPLSYLWQRDQSELLSEMVDAGLEAILIKVAGIGLTTKHLGKTLAEMQPTLLKLNTFYGSHVCGEGGEYETLTLDSPMFKSKIKLVETETVIHSDNDFATVAYLRIKNASLEPKESAAIDPTVPQLLDDTYDSVRQAAELNSNPEPVLSIPQFKAKEPLLHLYPQSSHKLGPWVTVTNVQSTAILGDISISLEDEVRECFEKLRDQLDKYSLNLSHCTNINIFISSMDLFVNINGMYQTFFGSSPPTRACVAVDFSPSPNRVKLDSIAYAEEKPSDRQALHVQGLSYWAPANIGPYSQAVTIKDERVFISGQIGLIPSELILPIPRSLPLETALACQHAARIVDVLKTNSGGGWEGHVQLALYWMARLSDVDHVRRGVQTLKENVPTLFLGVPDLPKNALVEKQVVVHTGRFNVLNEDDEFEVRSAVPVVSSGTLPCAQWELSVFSDGACPCAVVCVQGFPDDAALLELETMLSGILDRVLSIRLFYRISEHPPKIPPSLLKGRQAVTTVPCNFIATHGRHDWDYALCFVGV